MFHYGTIVVKRLVSQKLLCFFQILEEFETIIQSPYKNKKHLFDNKANEKRKYFIKIKTFGILVDMGNDPYRRTAESRQFGQDVHQQGTGGNQV